MERYIEQLLVDIAYATENAELFAGFVDEDLSPEEERAREVDCEIRLLERKYGETEEESDAQVPAVG